MRKSTVTRTAHPAAAQNAPRPTCHRDATLWLQARLQDSTLCDMLARAHPDYSRPHAWRHLDDHVAALAGTVVAQVVAHAQTAALVPVDELTPEQVAARWTQFHGGGTIALYAGGGWLSITRNGRPQKSFPVKLARKVLTETTARSVCGPSLGKRMRLADLAPVRDASGFLVVGAATGRFSPLEVQKLPPGAGVRGIAASAAAILAKRAGRTITRLTPPRRALRALADGE